MSVEDYVYSVPTFLYPYLSDLGGEKSIVIKEEELVDVDFAKHSGVYNDNNARTFRKAVNLILAQDLEDWYSSYPKSIQTIIDQKGIPFWILDEKSYEAVDYVTDLFRLD